MRLRLKSLVHCEFHEYQLALHGPRTYLDLLSGSDKRMKLRFNRIEDLLAHIDQITTNNHQTLGQWTAAQNFFHLAAAFEGSLEGLPAGYPVLIRFVARRFRWIAVRYRFPPWVPIPSAIRYSLGPPESCDFSTQKRRLVQAIEKFQHYTQEHPPHPVFGCFTHVEWIGFHLRHCEHHLSFIAIGH